MKTDTNATTGPANTATNSTIPLEDEEIPFPADSVPFTWGDFKKWVLPISDEADLSAMVREKSRDAKIEWLEMKILALNVLRELGPQLSQEKQIEVMERMATSFEAIAGSSADQVEAITNAGDSITLAALFRVVDGLPPTLLAALKNHLGMQPGEPLKA